MEIKIAGRKRIKDRGIKWVPAFHERSRKLKERFDELIGPLAYERWEGHDYTTNSDYFVIVGPSLTKEGKKRFFAGIKKLPDDPKAKVYAPSGEYFSTIAGAFSHASTKWGVPYPQNHPQYDLNSLKNVHISRHLRG